MYIKGCNNINPIFSLQAVSYLSTFLELMVTITDLLAVKLENDNYKTLNFHLFNHISNDLSWSFQNSNTLKSTKYQHWLCMKFHLSLMSFKICFRKFHIEWCLYLTRKYKWYVVIFGYVQTKHISQMLRVMLKNPEQKFET